MSARPPPARALRPLAARTLRPLTTAALAALLALLPCACAIGVERSGSERFLEAGPRDLAWEPGRTTLLEVARALGPPDWVRRSGEDVIFVYRFRRQVESGLLVQFYLNLLTAERARRADTTLVAAFDPDGRLLYHAFSEGKGSAPAPGPADASTRRPAGPTAP